MQRDFFQTFGMMIGKHPSSFVGMIDVMLHWGNKPTY
jgi:hypothetical protein